MKKLICLLGIAFCFCSCAKKSEFSGSTQQINQTENTSTLIKCSQSTALGRYCTGLSENKTMLCYIDYDTKAATALCPAPSCAHNSNSCTALLEENKHTNFLYTLGEDKLAAVVSGSIKGDQSKLMILNTDGSNRKDIYTSNSGEIVVEPIATDGENIYFRIEQSSEENQKHLVMTIPIKGGEPQQVCEISSREAAVLGVAGASIYFYEYEWGTSDGSPRPVFDENATEEEIQKLVDEYDSKVICKHNIYSVNVNTKEKTSYADWQSKAGGTGNKKSLMQDENIYLCDKENILQITQEKALKEIKINWQRSLAEDDVIKQIDAVINNKAIVTIENNAKMELIRFAVDLTSGEALPLSLSFILNGHITPLVICGANENSLLVQYDSRMQDTVSVGPDGTPYNKTIYTAIYAMITAEDFLNNSANYHKIDSNLALNLYA